MFSQSGQRIHRPSGTPSFLESSVGICDIPKILASFRSDARVMYNPPPSAKIGLAAAKRLCLTSGERVVYQRLEQLRNNIQLVFLGPTKAVDLLLVGLLARGHVLIEDVPGVGKTVLARSLARSIDCRFSRIQLTPDLLPSDVLGVSVYDNQAKTFEFKPGPI